MVVTQSAKNGALQQQKMAYRTPGWNVGSFQNPCSKKQCKPYVPVFAEVLPNFSGVQNDPPFQVCNIIEVAQPFFL